METAASKNLIRGHGALADFLTRNGFPIAPSTITKYCSPKINKGPPKAGRWGGQDLFEESPALEWARCRSGITEHAA